MNGCADLGRPRRTQAAAVHTTSHVLRAVLGRVQGWFPE
jgi:hypothetical protein